MTIRGSAIYGIIVGNKFAYNKVSIGIIKSGTPTNFLLSNWDWIFLSIWYPFYFIISLNFHAWSIDVKKYIKKTIFIEIVIFWKKLNQNKWKKIKKFL